MDEDSGRTITLRGEEPGPEEETMLQCKSVEDVTLLHPQPISWLFLNGLIAVLISVLICHHV